MILSNRFRGAALVALVTAATGAGAAVAVGSGEPVRPAAAVPTQTSTGQPGVSIGVFNTGASARAAARAGLGAISLPPGGNFNGIHWDVIDDGGISATELTDVLERNAYCQWVRYVSAHRSPSAITALRALPKRERLAASPNAAQIQESVTALAAGRESDPAAAAALASCADVHASEERAARASGLAGPAN